MTPIEDIILCLLVVASYALLVWRMSRLSPSDLRWLEENRMQNVRRSQIRQGYFVSAN